MQAIWHTVIINYIKLADSRLYNVLGFADNSIYKQGMYVNNRKILSLNELEELDAKLDLAVIVAAREWYVIGEQLFDYFSDSNQFIGFFDINKSGEYMGYPIFYPTEDRIRSCSFIIVAVYAIDARQNIIKTLEQYRMVRNIDYILMCNEALNI